MPEGRAVGRREAMLWVDLPVQAESVARARRLIAGLHGLPASRLSDIQLIVSELATNALRHGTLEPEDVFRVTIARHGNRLRVDVDDGGTFTASYEDWRLAPALRRDGFGLRIVEALSARWQADEGRVSVWIDI